MLFALHTQVQHTTNQACTNNLCCRNSGHAPGAGNSAGFSRPCTCTFRRETLQCAAKQPSQGDISSTACKIHNDSDNHSLFDVVEDKRLTRKHKCDRTVKNTACSTLNASSAASLCASRRQRDATNDAACDAAQAPIVCPLRAPPKM